MMSSSNDSSKSIKAESKSHAINQKSLEEDEHSRSYGDVTPNELQSTADGQRREARHVSNFAEEMVVLEESGEKMSKKAANKRAAKLEKLFRKQELAARKTSSDEPLSLEDESFSRNYGDVNPNELQSAWREAVEGQELTVVSNLVEEMVGSEVLIRGRVHKKRLFGKKLFVILRQTGFTVQCVAVETRVGANMVKFVKQLSCESVVEVIGVVSPPEKPLTGTTQQVEIHVRKMYCLSRSLPNPPFVVADAARSEEEIENSVKLFREFLQSKWGFVEIHTPKLMAGSSEGGSAVFRLDYKGQPACLAQSPQLHKQMAICGDFGRVFEIGPVFRAEDSFTHRHLCEFVGLDVEMEIHKDYSEIMDLVGELFPFIFTKIEERCPKELEFVRKQYPFQSLKFLPETLRLTFAEGVQMLKEAGEEVDPLGDLNTESERKLGQLVLEKYKTEFYIMHRYPSAVRPFYTMPCADDSDYSNSFDVFVRGEEIISGAQRIHIPEVLEKRAKNCGIDVKTISTYIDSFRYGAPPHGGFGAGLERLVMLFCALNNIRKTSLFPRDSQRLTP